MEDEEEGEEGKDKKQKKNINVRAAFIHVIGDLIQSIGVLIAAGVIKANVSDIHISFVQSQKGVNSMFKKYKYKLPSGIKQTIFPFCGEVQS